MTGERRDREKTDEKIKLASLIRCGYMEYVFCLAFPRNPDLFIVVVCARSVVFSVTE